MNYNIQIDTPSLKVEQNQRSVSLKAPCRFENSCQEELAVKTNAYFQKLLQQGPFQQFLAQNFTTAPNTDTSFSFKITEKTITVIVGSKSASYSAFFESALIDKVNTIVSDHLEKCNSHEPHSPSLPPEKVSLLPLITNLQQKANLNDMPDLVDLPRPNQTPIESPHSTPNPSPHPQTIPALSLTGDALVASNSMKQTDPLLLATPQDSLGRPPMPTPQYSMPPLIEMQDMLESVKAAYDFNLNAKINELQKQLKTAEARIAELNTAVTTTRQEKEESAAQMQALRTHLDQLQQGLTSAQDTASTAQTEIARLVTEIRKKENENLVLTKQLEAAKLNATDQDNRIKELLQTIEQLNARIKELEAQLAEALEQRANSETTKGTMETALKHARNEAALAAKRADATQQELAAKIKQLEAEHTQALNHFKDALKRDEITISDRNTTIAQRDASIKSQEIRIQELELQIQKLGTALQTQTEAAQKAADELAEVTKTRAALREQLQASQEAASQAQAKITELTETARSTQQQVQELTKTLAERNSTLQTHKDAARRADDALAEMTKIRDGLLEQLQASQEAASQAQAKITELTETAKSAQGEATQLRKAITENKNQRAELVKQLEAAKLNATNQDARIKELLQQIKELEARIKELENQLAEALKYRTAAEAAKKDAEAAHAQAVNSFKAATTRDGLTISGRDMTIAQHNANIKSQESRIKELELQIAQLTQTTTEKENAAAKALANAQAELPVLQKEIIDVLAQRANDSVSIAARDRTIHTLQEKIKKLRAPLKNSQPVVRAAPQSIQQNLLQPPPSRIPLPPTTLTHRASIEQLLKETEPKPRQRIIITPPADTRSKTTEPAASRLDFKHNVPTGSTSSKQDAPAPAVSHQAHALQAAVEQFQAAIVAPVEMGPSVLSLIQNDLQKGNIQTLKAALTLLNIDPNKVRIQGGHSHRRTPSKLVLDDVNTMHLVTSTKDKHGQRPHIQASNIDLGIKNPVKHYEKTKLNELIAALKKEVNGATINYLTWALGEKEKIDAITKMLEEAVTKCNTAKQTTQQKATIILATLQKLLASPTLFTDVVKHSILLKKAEPQAGEPPIPQLNLLQLQVSKLKLALTTLLNTVFPAK